MLFRYVYWPRSPEYAIPWIAGPVLYLLLGVFGLPGGKSISLGSVPTNLSGYVLAMLLLLGLNALLLWIHMRPQFLTWSTGCKRFWGTFLFLAVGHLLVWGFVLLMQGRAQLALSNIDWSFTVEHIDLALLGFTVVLLASAVWKAEEPGVSNLRLERDNARRLIGRLQDSTLESEEFRDLEPTLKQLEESARPLAARLTGPDLDLLRAWRNAGKDLLGQVQGLDANDIARIRRDAAQVISQAVKDLARRK